MKKRSNHFIYLMIIYILSLSAHGQVKIGGDPNNIQPSSLLDIASASKGFLPTRMTTAQRDAIIEPAVGLVIYNTTTNCLNHYVGSYWIENCGAITPLPAALGSTFTSFSNGTPSNENFSANAICQNKLISAGHSPGTCFGTLTIGSNTYNLLLLHGQCWMQSNLREAPTAPCADAINTGCNIWLASTPGDIGSWGYYHTGNTSGSSGWRTTVPAANEGMLYQWSAAMNGSTAERAKGVCPTGWHIPSDCEWMYLEHGQGMSISRQNTSNQWRNTTGEGSKLRSGGSNSSGFTGLLAGYRIPNGTFWIRGTYGYWWSSSATSPTLAHFRALSSVQPPSIYRSPIDKATGYSVRCLKD